MVTKGGATTLKRRAAALALAAAALMTTLVTPLPARAARNGTWRLTDCPGTTGEFTRTNRHFQNIPAGFGQTPFVARLTNLDGSNTSAGLILDLGPAAERANRDYAGLRFLIFCDPQLDDNIILRLCFRDKNGLGSPVLVERNLGILFRSRGVDGREVFVGSDVGGLKDVVLEKVTFQLKAKGEMLIGDTIAWGKGPGGNSVPTNLDMTKHPCADLQACPD